MNDAKTYGAAGAAVILVVLGIVAWLRAPEPDPAATAALAATVPQADPMLDARSKGAPEAPIAIYELSDFQCPFCKQFFDETLPALQEEYLDTGKARLTFINLPLIQIHGNAAPAAEVAMCAAAQGQFWSLHDLLFETQDEWKDLESPQGFFESLVALTDLDADAMQQCVSSGAARPIVAADVRMAMTNRLSTTPTFIIEGGVLQGAAPIDDWRPILDSIYAAKTGG